MTELAAERFANILLHDVLHYLALRDILRAMAVNRLWRDQAINHPTYYGELFVLDRDPSGYTDLFLLRISRSAHRPVSVFIERNDTRLIQAVADHLSHIRRLTLQFPVTVSCPKDQLSAILGALCRPAPILTRLFIRFPERPAPGAEPRLPRDLLAGHAPLLERVAMNNIAFPTGTGIPDCFANISLLSFACSGVRQPGLALPCPFERCRNLRALFLRNNVALDPEEFLASRIGNRLSNVAFNGYPVACKWPAFQLPMAGITRVSVEGGNGASAAALADTLSGILEVTFLQPPIVVTVTEPGSAAAIRKDFRAMLRSASRSSTRSAVVREIQGDLSIYSGMSTISVFAKPSFADRIVRLVIPLNFWEDLVGLSVFGPFDALDTLELVLALDARSRLDDTVSSELRCPRLKRLLLKCAQSEGEGELPAVEVELSVEASALVGFALTALPRTTFPLLLGLHGVRLNGSSDGFTVAFRSSDSEAREKLGLRKE